MIVGIREGPKLGFTSTTHKHNLYQGKIDGETVLVCHKVDDFAIATRMPSAAEMLIDVINRHATTSSKGIGTPSNQGIHIQYNRLNVHQTHNYVKLSCETYIDCVLQMHGWETPSAHESNHHDSVPITPDASNVLMQLAPGPSEDTPDYGALEQEVGFSY